MQCFLRTVFFIYDNKFFAFCQKNIFSSKVLQKKGRKHSAVTKISSDIFLLIFPQSLLRIFSSRAISKLLLNHYLFSLHIELLFKF